MTNELGSMPGTRVGFIQPQLQGYGGLEKYGVVMIHALSEHMHLDVITAHPVNTEAVERAFNVCLDHVRFVCDARCLPGLQAGAKRLESAWNMRRAMRGYEEVTQPYDLVIGQTVSLPWRSRAKRSLLFCHFPVVREWVVKPSVPHRGLRSLVSAQSRMQRNVRRRLDSWTSIATSSEYSSQWIRKYWQREPTILHPPIDLPQSPQLEAKRPWIVGAGFFSPPCNPAEDPYSYKRQEILIEVFQRLCDRGLAGWELHLAGHALQTAEVQGFLERLRSLANGYPVFFHPNCSHEELCRLYRNGSIFWHAVGHGVAVARYPERVEHFGIVTAEAMAWGCVPVVINLGGQPEIVQSGRSGFLWETLEEMEAATLRLINDPALHRQMSCAAMEGAARFDTCHFRQKAVALVEQELSLAHRS
jgi:glycosyltransferase involved in cell wall biosynthesis